MKDIFKEIERRERRERIAMYIAAVCMVFLLMAVWFSVGSDP